MAKFKRKFLRCTSLVNPNAVERKTIDGVEHIIVTSFTLPENIVMNGIMYPAEEIDSSFEGLNRTLAPVEHPTNSAGQFVSASDPEAIHSFHAGAFNDNAVKVGNRVRVDKIINVQEAMKSDRGRRLLDRIEEVENSDKPRPIHTSTGIFLEIETLETPQTNNDGDEYAMVARNMIFDHDAILLNSIGAAQPSQGVGMAINSAGEKIDVETIDLDRKDSRTNQIGLSYRNLIEQLTNEVEGTVSSEWLYIVDVFDDVFIIETDAGYFETPYRVDNERARVIGMPIRVERIVSYQPKTNARNNSVMKEAILNALKAVGIDTEGMNDDDLLEAYNKHMVADSSTTKDAIVNALKAADVKTDGLDDAALLAAYNELIADDSDDEGEDAVTTAVKAAVKPLQDKIDALETKANAGDDAVKADSIKAILASNRYPDMDEDTLKTLPTDKLQSMAANCGVGYGLPLSTNLDGDVNQAPVAMPE